MAITVENLRGVYPAIITPMLADGSIDFATFDILLEDLVVAGVAGICVCGTTGQSATLDKSEHLRLAVHAYEKIAGRCQYIASAGSNSTKQSLGLTQAIEKELGAITFLQVTGYYNIPPQEGIKAHFEALAAAIDSQSNIILYNVPGRTVANIDADTTIALSKNPKIIGLKDAAGNPEQCKEIIEGTDSSSFRVLTGDCDQIESVLKAGGFGSISASANVAPKLFVKLVDAALAGDWEQAESLQAKVMPLVEAVFCAKNPIPLSMMFDSSLRLPMVPLPAIKPEIDAALAPFTTDELGIDLSKYVG